MAAAATAAASAAPSLLSALRCRSLASFKQKLAAHTRLAALDITPGHVALALSDRGREAAVPFGVLARTAKPSADARILRSALRRADRMDPAGALDVSGLVVAVAPGGAEAAAAYTADLLAELEDGVGMLFPGLSAVLFYSEAHTIARSVRAQNRFLHSAALLPQNLESRKRKRFASHMDPKVPVESMNTDPSSKARISASEVLQIVLEDLRRKDASGVAHRTGHLASKTV